MIKMIRRGNSQFQNFQIILKTAEKLLKILKNFQKNLKNPKNTCFRGVASSHASFLSQFSY
nr:MAG TPA: hypothetical protein [Caudoviricetes sp.]